VRRECHSRGTGKAKIAKFINESDKSDNFTDKEKNAMTDQRPRPLAAEKKKLNKAINNIET
jgi:hypothetical protein